MQYLSGESLEQRLARDGRLPVAEVLRLGRQIAEGLAAAHAANVVHRDVKPSNLWLAGEKVKLLDFGLAWAPEDGTRITRVGSCMGTPAFLRRR